MKIENGVLVMEMRDCSRCYGSGTNPTRKPCARCNGTGRTKGGIGKGNCKASGCYGGMVIDHDHTVVCEKCDGNAVKCQLESPFEYLQWSEIVNNIPFVVSRNDQADQSFMQAYIGVGLYSTTDYGDHIRMSDAELIAKVVDHGSSTQGVKIVRSKDDLRVCHKIVISTNYNGYDVIPYFVGD